MTNQKKTLGNIVSMDCTINNMKIEHMEFREIMLLIGANGTGKTFILILSWIAGTAVNMYLMSKDRSATIHMIQLLFDKSFDNQDFSGECTAYFEGCSIFFKMDAGKVIDFSVTNQAGVEAGSPPQFMSKNSRLYSDVVRYMKIRNKIGLAFPMTEQDGAKYLELLDLYKIYDVMFFDRLIMRTMSGHRLDNITRTTTKNTIGRDIVSIHSDITIPDMLYELEDGSKKSLTTLSAGEQAWINMTTSVSI